MSQMDLTTCRFGKFTQSGKHLLFQSKDDLDSVPQKHPSSVARELSTVLEKYKDVSSAKFSIQENEPEATQGKQEF